MSTGEKGKIDQELLKGLKDAKSARCHFACVMASPQKGHLLIMKHKVPAPEIAAAKKDCGGTQTIEGECLYENGSYVFETDDEPAQTFPGVLKLFAKQQSGTTIKVLCRANPNLQVQPSSQPPNRPVPQIPNTTGGGQTPPNTVGGNAPTNTVGNAPTNTDTTKVPNNRPLQKPPQQTTPQNTQQPSRYTSENDWRKKINQVDVAAVPAGRKLPAYDKIRLELKGDVDRLAQDKTLDQGAKGTLQLMHQSIQSLLTLRRNTVDARAQQDAKTGPLSEARKGSNQRAAVFVNGVGDKLAPLNLTQSMKPFSKANVDAMSTKTDASDSKFGSVTTAMNLFREAEVLLKSGKVDNDGFMAMVNKVKQEATTYRNEHKSAMTSAGKQRIKQCDAALTAILEVERAVVDKNAELHEVLADMAAEIQRGGVCPQMRDMLNVMLKSPYTSSANATVATKLRAEVIRLLQTKSDQAMNTRPNAPSAEKAELLLQYGGANPPSGKGQSDSFFINNPDGSPAFMFKSIEGEARNSLNWPEGGGAPREVLASKMNDLMKTQTGIDFKIAKTTLFKTEDDKFKSGTISKSPKRSGALQEAIQIDATKPTSPSDFLKAPKGQSVSTKYDALNSDDVESMAVLDFMTMNLDRHGDNVLLQNAGDQPGQTRLVPIDAGLMFPTKDAFRVGANSLISGEPYDPNNPIQLDATANMVTQLPQGNRPFSQKSKDAIAKLDPDQFVAAMKVQFETMVSEAPEMAGKVDESSFDLMKKSITMLKKAASQDLTPRQISKLYATVLPKIMDAPDNQFDAAITKAINELKQIEQLGGEQALMAKGVTPTQFPIAIQKEILEKNLSVDGAKQIHYVDLQHELTDLPTFLEFENGNKFQLGDRLTRPYSAADYGFLEMSADFKRIGGDPALRALFAGEPALLDANIKLPLEGKFPAMQRANTIVKNGGFAKVRAQVGDAEYNKFVAANDLWAIDLAAAKQ